MNTKHYDDIDKNLRKNTKEDYSARRFNCRQILPGCNADTSGRKKKVKD